MDELRDLIARIVREEMRTFLGQTYPTQEYLSTRDAATLAKVSQGTVRRWVREERLAPFGAGRELRVSRAQLEAMMSAPRRRSSQAPDASPEILAMRALGLR